MSPNAGTSRRFGSGFGTAGNVLGDELRPDRVAEHLPQRLVRVPR